MNYVQMSFVLGMVFGGCMVYLGYISGPYIVNLFRLKPKKEDNKTVVGPMLQETLNQIEREREAVGYYKNSEEKE